MNYYNERKGEFKGQRASIKALGCHLDIVPYVYAVLIMLSGCVML